MRLFGILFTGLLIACQSDPTVLLIKVTAKDAVLETDKLRVGFTNNSIREEKIFETTGTLFGSNGPLTVDLVIQADGRIGQADIDIDALDRNQNVVGHGLGSIVLLPQQQITLAVRIDPSDFQVNTQPQNDQIFSTTDSGRQLASDQQGNFVVVWEDKTDELGRYNIYGRLFDEKTKPRLVSGTTQQFRANATSEYYDMPAVAMRSDGSFFVVWRRGDETSYTKGIFGLLFQANGSPAKTYEEEISDANGQMQINPAIASLPSGGFVIVWEQTDLYDSRRKKVAIRTLSSDGIPLGNSPTEVANWISTTTDNIQNCTHDSECSAGHVCSPLLLQCVNYASPFVAASGTQGEFLVVWRQEGKAYANFYQADGINSYGAQTIATYSSDHVKGINATGTQYGYVIVWSEKGICDEDSDGSCIRIRSFQPNGVPLENDYTLNTTFLGDQECPAVTMRQDGILLTVWSTIDESSNEPGDLRGRIILSSGQATGNDFVVTSTTNNLQTRPSVAGRGLDAFIVAYEDGSNAGEDKNGTSIRGRIVYTDSTYNK